MSIGLWIAIGEHQARVSIRKGLSKRRHLIRLEKEIGKNINKTFARNCYKQVKKN